MPTRHERVAAADATEAAQRLGNTSWLEDDEPPTVAFELAPLGAQGTVNAATGSRTGWRDERAALGPNLVSEERHHQAQRERRWGST